MSAGFNVTVDGQKITIKAGQKIDDIKEKFGDDVGNIFDNVDKNNNGKLDEAEIGTLKTNLQNRDYKIETAEDGRTPRKAYNDAMQNLKGSYDSDKLNGFFKKEDGDLHQVRKGETLFTIAKAELEKEGLPTDFRSVNNRIAQIANLNNINDVNNISEGTKLITKLTDDAITKVKAKNGDSALALNNKTADVIDGDDWTEKGSKGSVKKNNADVVDDRVDQTYKKQKTAVDGKQSEIEITKNGLNMGKGVPVDADGNVLKDFKDPKFKAGGSIMKYTNAKCETMYQTVYGEKSKTTMLRGVKITGASIEEVKNKEKALLDTIAKIKSAPQNETEEAKTKRCADNLAALKELISISGGNEQIVKNVASKLIDDKLVDRKSNEYKSLVQNLLLTRNGGVVKAITTDSEDNTTMAAVENDRTAHETMAGMYKEIREKEKAGEKLSDNEISLKDALQYTRNQDGFKISEEKTLNYNRNGEIFYNVTIDGKYYYATNEKLLDEFVAELKTADTDDKKRALFKKYSTTKDKELAKCLLAQSSILKASDDDLKTIINSNGMEVLSNLENPNETEYSDDIIKTMNERIKTIYTKDRGNLENAEYLRTAQNWLLKSGLSDKDKNALGKEIAETYFMKIISTDKDGKEKTEYSFNPSRRPTYEEIEELAKFAGNWTDANEVGKALGRYTKVEDMGKGQYNEGMENFSYGGVVDAYAEKIESMTKDEVLEFISKKIISNKEYHIPFDAILDKFSEDKDIKDKLIMYTAKSYENNISNEHRLELAKAYFKDDGKGNYAFDKASLPKGATVQNIIRTMPVDCTKGETQKMFKAIFKTLDFNSLDMVLLLNDCNFNIKDKEISNRIRKYILDPKNKGTEVYNSIVTNSNVQSLLSPAEKQKIFDESSNEVRGQLAGDFKDDSKYKVYKGEKLDNIIKSYLKAHLDNFPELQKSINSNKEKWNNKRIDEALNDYVRDFRNAIAKDLGLEDASKLKAKTILDFSKVDWKKHQPNWFVYKFTY